MTEGIFAVVFTGEEPYIPEMFLFHLTLPPI